MKKETVGNDWGGTSECCDGPQRSFKNEISTDVVGNGVDNVEWS
jgi:hypothetical protein